MKLRFSSEFFFLSYLNKQIKKMHQTKQDLKLTVYHYYMLFIYEWK